MAVEVIENNDFEKLFNLSIDMMCIADVHGYFKKINASFVRVLQHSEEDLLSVPFIEFVHQDDIASTLQEIETLKQGKETCNFENRYRHQDGSYRILSWAASSDQATGSIYAVARDVTEERLLTNKLLQINKALNTETIVAMTDATGLITHVNKKFCEISGYEEHELIGQNHRIINSGKHAKDFFTNLWDTISSGNTWSGMIENRNKNGEHYFVLSIITPIFDVVGKISNYLSIRFDATEQVSATQSLEKTITILNEVSELGKVGGWEMNIATEELTWTDETFKIFEVTKKETLRPSLSEGLSLFTDEAKPIIKNAINKAILFGEPYELELLAQTSNGRPFWLYTSGKATYENGKVVFISGIVQDINARKIEQQEYETQKNISSQTAKLASLGELSAGIAHEINNPLSIVYGSIQLLSRYTDNPEKFSANICRIEKSCDRIARIVKSLKKFSRTSEDGEFSVFFLSELVDEAIILTNAKAKKYQTRILFNKFTDAKIYCDEVEIEQVIVNLLNNAVFATQTMADRWVNIDVIENNKQVIFTITDSGSGIRKDKIDKIFNPFFTTKAVGQGTGLGLSITKGILDRHNATIELDKKSEFTCFIITFNKA